MSEGINDVKRDTLDVGPGVVSGELACGFVDGDGKHHSSFTVEEMSGEEEDLLAGTGPMVDRMNRIITNCTKNIGEIQDKAYMYSIITNMPMVDRMIMLIAIRRATLGDVYRMRISCPRCRQESDASVDLGQLKMRKMEDPMVREFAETLVRGTTVKWHVMLGQDEEWLSKQRKHNKSNKDARMTLAMLCRVDELNGEKIERNKGHHQALKALKNMKGSERNQLRNIFKEKEGYLDTEIVYTCAECNHTFRGEMDPGQASFFFPQDD